MEKRSPFLLAAITAPDFFAGEAACLEELLAAGLEKLHLRKPEGSLEEMEALLEQIAPRWSSRLVLHPWSGKAVGGRELVRLATRYGIPQIHCPLKDLPEVSHPSIAVSISLHSWSAVKETEGTGLAYVFVSPVFDSLSKPGYAANPLLLRRPAETLPCTVKAIGLGGVDKETLSLLIREGWEGAAVLGYLWNTPGDAPKRYEQLKNVIEDNCPCCNL